MFLFQFLFDSLNPADLTVTQSSGWSASVNESCDASLYWSSVSFLHHFFLTVNWFTNFISQFFFVFFSVLLFLFPCFYFFTTVVPVVVLHFSLIRLITISFLCLPTVTSYFASSVFPSRCKSLLVLAVLFLSTLILFFFPFCPLPLI